MLVLEHFQQFELLMKPLHSEESGPQAFSQQTVLRAYHSVLRFIGLRPLTPVPVINADFVTCRIKHKTVLTIRPEIDLDHSASGTLFDQVRETSHAQARSSARSLLDKEATAERIAKDVRKLLARNHYSLLKRETSEIAQALWRSELFKASRTASTREACPECTDGKVECTCRGRGQGNRKIRVESPCPYPLCEKGRIPVAKDTLTGKETDYNPLHIWPAGPRLIYTTRWHERCSGTGVITRYDRNPDFCPTCRGKHVMRCSSCQGRGERDVYYRGSIIVTSDHSTEIEDGPQLNPVAPYPELTRYDPSNIDIQATLFNATVHITSNRGLAFWRGEIREGDTWRAPFEVVRDQVTFGPFLDDHVAALVRNELNYRRDKGGRLRFRRFPQSPLEKQAAWPKNYYKLVSQLNKRMMGSVTYFTLWSLVRDVQAARKNIWRVF